MSRVWFGLFEYEGAIVCRVPALDLVHPNKRAELEKELFESACAGFNREQSEAFYKDVADHLREGILYVAMESGKAIGFAVMKDFSEIHGTYMAGVVKKPQAPSGIVEAMVEYHIASNGYEVVAVRTQNDRVLEIMTKVCQLVVPIHREAGQKEFNVLEIMGLLNKNVGVDLVASRHYGGEPMISGLPRRRSKNPIIVRTSERLDYDHGDALMAVGYVKGEI